MGNMFVGLTDYDLYCNLKSENFDDVNFWRPGNTAFKDIGTNICFT